MIESTVVEGLHEKACNESQGGNTDLHKNHNSQRCQSRGHSNLLCVTIKIMHRNNLLSKDSHKRKERLYSIFNYQNGCFVASS